MGGLGGIRFWVQHKVDHNFIESFHYTKIIGILWFAMGLECHFDRCLLSDTRDDWWLMMCCLWVKPQTCLSGLEARSSDSHWFSSSYSLYFSHSSCTHIFHVSPIPPLYRCVSVSFSLSPVLDCILSLSQSILSLWWCISLTTCLIGLRLSHSYCPSHVILISPFSLYIASSFW